MLVAVVVLFVICWGPILVDNMLTSYGYLPRVKAGTHKHLNTAFQLMAYFNSCINPIVYGFMSKHFRESFLSAACGGWWICCPRKGYRAPVKRHPSLSQTRTTSISGLSFFQRKFRINVDKRTVREVRQHGKYFEISEIEDVGNFLCFERWRSSRVSAFLTTLDKLKKLEVGTKYSEEVEAKNGKLRKARVIKIWKTRKVEFKKYKIR
ncbi:hypothetical protein K0M31_006599 [Melipona bicolor]|uniref:G-protein coupled receptors family 1 profile domain-containing protein n=1 Tax=Melipona bicolor TaxID=60889 RepID=A0AA40FS02_9HYME|nr:hypothetical protein K0M31_006599 [Melipona bicolor]